MTQLYLSHLESTFSKSEFLIFKILLDLLQIHKWVRLETLANSFTRTIEFESRRKKMQIFLSSKKLDIHLLWFPIVEIILTTFYPLTESVYLVIDRTRWKTRNILMISLLYDKRAIPIYFELLDKKGNTSVTEQIAALSKVMPLFKNYHKIVLGDREFCGVDLAKWLSEQDKMDFCLRIKKNVGVAAWERAKGTRVYIEINEETKTLESLGLLPGISVYYQGIKITKTKGFAPINLAAKWKKTYKKKKTKEPWFIMTSFNNLQGAIDAYSRRMGIEEMFRDFKKRCDPGRVRAHLRVRGVFLCKQRNSWKQSIKAFINPSDTESQQIIEAILTPSHTNTFKTLLNKPLTGTFNQSRP